MASLNSNIVAALAFFMALIVVDANFNHVYEKCTRTFSEGSGHSRIRKFYWDSMNHRCRTFYYRGSGGNENNFDSYLECRNECDPSYQTATDPKCAMSKPSQKRYGGCRQRMWYFYFERNHACYGFSWNGCQSEMNAFSSRAEC